MKTLLVICIAGALALNACTTEIIAPAGSPGQDGIDGRDGNANVQITIHDVTWSTPDTVIWVAEVLEANIMLDILENGTVQVFLSNDKKNWLQIPFTFDSYQYLFWYNKGKVTLRAKNGGKIMPSNRLYKHGKIVVIEGTI
ncbi:MAG: hypothetical protein RIC30_13750 [Marinoscillum sp.]|uniref:hypothetical protein n=1 Tax=Marinoscillum sp. TaxID=2024838 RepID=UPI0032FF43E9